MMRAILDSSAVIDIFKEKVSVESVFRRYEEDYLTTIGMGELFYGAYHSTNVNLHLAECTRIQAEIPMLTVDDRVVPIYGRIKQELRSVGQMIPENDLWISTIAIANNATVVTKDKHSNRIDGLGVDLV